MTRTSDGRIAPKFDEETKQEIGRRWLAGEKSKDLVVEYGFTNQKAFRVMVNRWGFHKTEARKPLTADEITDIKCFYLAGWTMQDIADELNVTKQCVCNILKRNGFTYKDKPKFRVETEYMKQQVRFQTQGGNENE